MKIKVLTVLGVLTIVGIMGASVTGCNKQIIDTTYAFDKAIVKLQNDEVIEGEVDSWKDYDGDQIQVKINGVTYLVHSSNVTLIHE
jgi:ribosomal protein S1